MNIDNLPRKEAVNKPESTRLQKSLQLCMLLMTTIIYGGGYFLLSRNEELLANQTMIVTAGILIAIPILSLFVSLLTAAPFVFFYMMTGISFLLAALILPNPKPELYTYAIQWGGPPILASFVVFILYKLIKVRQDFLRVDPSKETIVRLEQSLTPLFGQGLLRRLAFNEIRLWYYCLYVWFKPPKIDADVSYTYHKTSMIKVLIIFGCIMLLIDVSVLHLLISLFSKTLAWIITISSIYLMFQLVAFYNSCRYEPHMVTDKVIILRLGFYSRTEFSPDQIDVFRHAPKNISDEDKTKDTFNCVLSLDSPQYELVLKEPHWKTYMLGGKEQITKIWIKLDDPDAFQDAVHLKINAEA